VSLNFGARPFAFDVRSLAAEEAAACAAAAAATPLPRDAPHALVRQYLRHYGYAATLRALDDAAPQCDAGGSGAAGSGAAGSDDPTRAEARAAVRAALQAGDVDAAEAAVRAAFPSLLPAAAPAVGDGGGSAPPPPLLRGPASDVMWSFAAARFLESLRLGDALGAISRGRATLAPFAGSSAERDAALAQLAALLAYDPAALSGGGGAACPLAHLLTQRQREAGADAVNHALLRAARGDGGGAQDRDAAGSDADGDADGDADDDDDGGLMSGLERALRQLAACQGALREAAGSQGERFDLRAAMLGSGGGSESDAHADAAAAAATEASEPQPMVD
jgi:hypothetical protein